VKFHHCSITKLVISAFFIVMNEVSVYIRMSYFVWVYAKVQCIDALYLSPQFLSESTTTRITFIRSTIFLASSFRVSFPIRGSMNSSIQKNTWIGAKRSR